MHAIDVWAQITTERMAAAPWLAPLLRWTGRADQMVPRTVEATLAAMDEAGVEIALLSAWHGLEGSLISNAEVEEMVSQAPDRFKGLACFDLNAPLVDGVKEVRARLESPHFVGVRIVPWLWGLPPNDRRYYPVFAACAEAGVPVCTQIGHTGPLRSSDTGRLIPYLEDVLLDFPELKVVGGHVGFPWIDELTSLTHKFPNLYVDTSAYALHRLPEDFVRYMKGPGKTRVMFGTNWPMLSPRQCLAGLDGLGLEDEHKEAFLYGTARKVFGL